MRFAFVPFRCIRLGRGAGLFVLIILLVVFIVISVLVVIIIVILLIVVLVILIVVLLRFWIRFRIGGLVVDGQLSDGIRIPIIQSRGGFKDLGDEILLFQGLELFQLQLLGDLLQLGELKGLKCGFLVHGTRVRWGKRHGMPHIAVKA